MTADEPAAGLEPYDMAEPARALDEMIQTGILAYGLQIPIRGLVPPSSPWREHEAAHAAERAAENAARLDRIATEITAASDAWRELRDRVDSPAVAAVMAIHRPYAGYDRIHCTECRESGWDGADPVDWPCNTHVAIKENTP